MNTLVLYLRPMWREGDGDYDAAWNDLVAALTDAWTDRLAWHETLSDRTLALLVEEPLLPLAMAMDAFDILGGRMGASGARGFPIQMLIDSYPYSKFARQFLENTEFVAEGIDTGHIYVSASAFGVMKKHLNPSVSTIQDPQLRHSWYKLMLEDNGCFLYHAALVRGPETPCFYCGSRRHVPPNCPSKHLPEVTTALDDMGYFSLALINRVYLAYISKPPPGPEAVQPGRENDGNAALLAHYSFFDLKRIFQLRFFRAIFGAGDEAWDKIRIRRGEQNIGGLAWLALDCLRVTEQDRAKSLMEAALAANQKDWRAHCALGFLNMERENIATAEDCFDRALHCATTNAQKIYLNLLLSRLYQIHDSVFKAQQQVREALYIDPLCYDALYYDILLEFQLDRGHEAVSKLVKLILQNREYFVHACIDPDLGPMSHLIQPHLERLMNESASEAERLRAEAQGKLTKVRQVLGEGSKEVAEAGRLWSEVEELSKVGSYFGNTDAVHRTRSVISICDRAITEMKRETRELLGKMDRKLDAVTSQLHGFSKGATQELKERLHHTRERLEDCGTILKLDIAKGMKEVHSRAKALDQELQQMEQEVESFLDSQRLNVFLTSFLKKTLLFLPISCVLTIFGFPVLMFGVNVLLTRLDTDPVSDFWSFQKALILLGIFLSLLMAGFNSYKYSFGRQQP